MESAWYKRLISYSDLNEIIEQAAKDSYNDKLSNDSFGSLILHRTQKLVLPRMFEHLNKERISNSFNVLLSVMQYDGELKIDLDSISAEDAEKIVRLLKNALE